MGPAVPSGEYRAFVLRLWREPHAGQRYRCSLEDSGTGQRRGFDSVDALLAFLAALTSVVEREDADPEPARRDGSSADAGDGAPPAKRRSR